MISRFAPAGTALLLLAACAPARPARLAPLTLPAAESVRVDTIAPGLVHYDIWSSHGPWAIQLLDADRACWSAVALKAGGQAIGRAPARELDFPVGYMPLRRRLRPMGRCSLPGERAMAKSAGRRA